MTDPDETRVRALMGEIARAFKERDVETLRTIFDDDFTLTEPGGDVIGKEEWLRDVASGDLTVTDVHSDSFDIRRVAETSFRVRGQLTIRACYARSNYNGSFAYMGVYTKHPDGWKLSLSSARRV